MLGHLRIITFMATSLGNELMRMSAEEYVENEKQCEIKTEGRKSHASHRELTKELEFSSKSCVSCYQRAYRLQRICFFYLAWQDSRLNSL